MLPRREKKGNPTLLLCYSNCVSGVLALQLLQLLQLLWLHVGLSVAVREGAVLVPYGSHLALLPGPGVRGVGAVRRTS